MLFANLQPLKQSTNSATAVRLEREKEGEGGREREGIREKGKEREREIVVASSHKRGLFSHSAVPPPGPSYVGDSAAQ